MSIKIPDFMGAELEVSSISLHEKHFVSLYQRSASMSFMHSMSPKSARAMAAALMIEAATVESLCDTEVPA